MFRQIKSALIWAYIYKFRKMLLKFAIVLVAVTIMLFMYSDIVEYLKLTDKLHLLPYVIVLKWAIVFLAIIYIVYTIIALKNPKREQKAKNSPKPVDNKKKPTKKEISHQAKEIIERKMKMK